MRILYEDKSILLCIKPAGVKSTDEPDGLPSLLRQTLGDSGAELRTVHRLDQVVSGLMLLARSKEVAGELGRQIMARKFEKEYLAVVHGEPQERGRFCDLLWRNKAERKSYVVPELGKGVQEAVLDYECLARHEGLSLMKIRLQTGRTHQIRAQFSAHGFPLVGERKYSTLPDDCDIALWSYCLAFAHPQSGESLCFAERPPQRYPWTFFHIGEENS